MPVNSITRGERWSHLVVVCQTASERHNLPLEIKSNFRKRYLSVDKRCIHGHINSLMCSLTHDYDMAPALFFQVTQLTARVSCLLHSKVFANRCVRNDVTEPGPGAAGI